MLNNGTVATPATQDDEFWGVDSRSASFANLNNNTANLRIAHNQQLGLDMSGSAVRMTMAAWINLRSFPGAGGAMSIMSKFNAQENAGYGFVVSGSNVGLGFNINDRAAESRFSGGGHLSLNRWYHVAVTVDYPGGNTVFYVDGNEVGVVSGFPAAIGANTGPFQLNRHDSFFDGLVHDAAVWNRALSPVEIKSLVLGVDLAALAFRPGNIPSGSPFGGNWTKPPVRSVP